VRHNGFHLPRFSAPLASTLTLGPPPPSVRVEAVVTASGTSCKDSFQDNSAYQPTKILSVNQNLTGEWPK